MLQKACKIIIVTWSVLLLFGCGGIAKKPEQKEILKLDDRYLDQILQDNRDKLFVKRILRTGNYKPLDLGNGQTASHLMAYGEADGKFFVFPTVLMMGDGKLKQFSSDQAWKRVHTTGNVIQFDSEVEAAWFSKNYKRYWARQSNY